MQSIFAAMLLTIVALTLATDATARNHDPAKREWREQGIKDLHKQLKQHQNLRRAKNVILFVGDGMGVSTVTASRIYDGQQKGMLGEENRLYFEKLPYLSLMKVYNTNQQTPDSAGTMTAMMTGVKTKAGVIGYDDDALRGDCESALGNELTSFLMKAEESGKATGIVSTARLTHATPAATYARTPERGWEDDDDVPEEAKALGCKDIAQQLVHLPYGDGLEVALGGGRRHFIPKDQDDPEDTGRTGNRTDGRDLTIEWVDKYPNAAWVWNEQQFNAISAQTTDHLLGTFERSHMEYEHDRENDTGGEPSIAQMTRKAIEILKKDRDGFFLMVESGRIDHAHHATNAKRALEDTLAFADAVRIADKITKDRDTLIMVTADHSHVFTIAGYPTRGNPILGKVIGNDSSGLPEAEPELAADDYPYTTLAYNNGRGGRLLDLGGDTIYGEPVWTGGRQDFSFTNTEDEGFFQEALVPLGSETHSGEDIALYAEGPWSHLFRRTHEQSFVYYVMEYAARLKR